MNSKEILRSAQPSSERCCCKRCDTAAPPEQCTLGNEAPCAPCSDLVRLEDKICEAKSILDGLINQRQALKSRINDIHDPVTRKLPPELVSRIFTFCLPRDRLLNPEYPTLPPSSTRQPVAPLLLTSVCKRWRETAFATPQIWACIYIYFKQEDIPFQTEVVREWLARSGRLPLSVHVVYRREHTREHYPSTDLFDPIIDLLNQDSDRWRDLDLLVPHESISRLHGNSHGASLLKRLRIHSYWDTYQENLHFSVTNGLPAPAVVDVVGMFFNSVVINWENVTHFKSEWIDVIQCLYLLQQAPRMISATVLMFPDAPSNLSATGPHILDQHLQLLNITLSGPTDMALLFDRLTLPQLEELGYYNGELNSLQALVERSSCPLTKIDLDCLRGETTTNVARFLYMTPLLESLSLHHSSTDNDFFNLFGNPALTMESEDTTESTFLPRLRSLTLECKRNFSWASLASIFPPTFELGKQYGRPLKTLSINIYGGLDEDIDDEEARERLLEIASGDIDLSILNAETDCDIIALAREYSERRRRHGD